MIHDCCSFDVNHRFQEHQQLFQYLLLRVNHVIHVIHVIHVSHLNILSYRVIHWNIPNFHVLQHKQIIEITVFSFFNVPVLKVIDTSICRSNNSSQINTTVWMTRVAITISTTIARATMIWKKKITVNYNILLHISHDPSIISWSTHCRCIT